MKILNTNVSIKYLYLAYILHFILQVISAVHHDGFKPVIINVFNSRIFV